MGDSCVSVLWRQVHSMEYTSEHAATSVSKLSAE